MLIKHKTGASLLCSLLLSALGACVGGGGGGGGGNESGTAATSPQLTGVAATGAALASATVTVTNSAGSAACNESSIVTNGLGSYTCTLKTGETAPFFIIATDPTGNSTPLVSIATETPAAGTSLTTNVTPLTTAIVAQLNNGDALGLANAHAVNISDLLQVKANVVAQLQAILTAIGAPANYDPFTTSITAATAGQTGNTADLVLDIVKVTKDASGALAFSTISDPTPILLATANNTGNSVSAPSVSVSELAKGAQLLAQGLNACFGVNLTARVTLDNTQEITHTANECQGFSTAQGVPTLASAFKHNGYSFNNFFYRLLTSDSMTGAKFSVPEVIAFYPADDTSPRDRAVVNIRYIDSSGYPGNRITMAERFPESKNADHPNDWWLTGNQKSYEIVISTEVWRNEELNSNPSNRFQNALRIWIEARNWSPQNADVTSVRVTGPGLPTLGLWYGRTDYASGFVLMNERSASLPNTFTQACAACVSYWISRTQGLSAAAATTYKTNPVKGNWAQGNSDGSYNGQNGAQVQRPKKGDVYTFEIYNGSTKVATETKKMLTDLVDATQLVKMSWNDIGPNSRAALDPNNSSLNGPQTSLAIDWIKNSSAEFIQYVWLSQTDGASDNLTTFSPGAASVVATPSNGSTYTALNVPVSEGPTVYAGYREIGFTYRMTDGSTKSASYMYWP